MKTGKGTRKERMRENGYKRSTMGPPTTKVMDQVIRHASRSMTLSFQHGLILNPPVLPSVVPCIQTPMFAIATLCHLWLVWASPRPLASSTSTYAELVRELEERRSEHAERYRTAAAFERPQVLAAARADLEDRMIRGLLPAWYGTPWDYNGTTRSPGHGTIACGYFVTTVLLDAGFRIPRTRWAQLASERLIMKFAPNAWRSSNTSVQAIRQWLLARGDGVYVAGLDNHVGFISVRRTNIHFIHSNYHHPETGVMAEPLEGNNPFAHSHHRVIGELFDEKMMIQWLDGRPW